MKRPYGAKGSLFLFRKLFLLPGPAGEDGQHNQQDTLGHHNHAAQQD